MRRPRMHPLIRERGSHAVALTAVVLGIIAIIMGDAVIETPFERGVTAVLWPALPLVLACAIPACASPQLPELTTVTARCRPRDRAAATGLYLLATAALCAVINLRLAHADVIAVALRSGAIGLGIALFLTVVLPQRAATTLPALLTIAVVLFGNRPGGTPAPWALIYHPPHESATTLIAVATATIGIALFIALGAHSERRASCVAGKVPR